MLRVLIKSKWNPSVHFVNFCIAVYYSDLVIRTMRLIRQYNHLEKQLFSKKKILDHRSKKLPVLVNAEYAVDEYVEMFFVQFFFLHFPN